MKIRIFYFPQKRKKVAYWGLLVEQEVEQTGVPNISTAKGCFSLIHNISNSIKTDSDSAK